jgi:hypothetical protein
MSRWATARRANRRQRVRMLRSGPVFDRPDVRVRELPALFVAFPRRFAGETRSSLLNSLVVPCRANRRALARGITDGWKERTHAEIPLGDSISDGRHAGFASLARVETETAWWFDEAAIGDCDRGPPPELKRSR